MAETPVQFGRSRGSVATYRYAVIQADRYLQWGFETLDEFSFASSRPSFLTQVNRSY